MSGDLPSQPIRVSTLDAHAPTAFTITPEGPALRAIATALGVDAVRKLRFSGHISPAGEHDWRLDATLGATVVQPCVVTLAPVTTRIDDDVYRLFTTQMPETVSDEDGDEIVGDETLEALGEEIDPASVMLEALALALPLYPRSGDAAGDALRAAPPGVAPMSDEQTRPFAGLAALRDKLSDKT